MPVHQNIEYTQQKRMLCTKVVGLPMKNFYKESINTNRDLFQAIILTFLIKCVDVHKKINLHREGNCGNAVNCQKSGLWMCVSSSHKGRYRIAAFLLGPIMKSREIIYPTLPTCDMPALIQPAFLLID